VTGQTASERRGDPQVEDVRQCGWVSAGAEEVREEASREADPPGSVQLHEKLHARTDAGYARRKAVIDVQGSEKEKARSTAVANPIRDELSGVEESHGPEVAGDHGSWRTVEKLAAGRLIAQTTQLHGGVHRPRSWPRSRGALEIAPMPFGWGVQS